MSFETANPPYNASDPHATFLNSSCFDFLQIELVPLAYRMAAEVSAQEQAWLNGSQKLEGQAKRESGVTSAAGVAGQDEEELRESVFYRLESLGYRVGLGIVER